MRYRGATRGRAQSTAQRQYCASTELLGSEERYYALLPSAENQRIALHLAKAATFSERGVLVALRQKKDIVWPAGALCRRRQRNGHNTAHPYHPIFLSHTIV